MACFACTLRAGGVCAIIPPMTKLRNTTLLIALFLAAIDVGAQTPSALIRNVLDRQTAAWNRGDLEQFVLTYAERCTLIGKQISEVTREQVLAHYQEKYPTSAAMGKLAFSNITVTPLDRQVALVTGEWHLAAESRPAAR